MSPFYLCVFICLLGTIQAKPHHHKRHHKHRSPKRPHREDDTTQDSDAILHEALRKPVPHLIQDHEDLQNAAAVDVGPSEKVSYEKSFLLEIAAKLRKYVNTISDNVQSLDDNVLSPLNRTLLKGKKSKTKAPPKHKPTGPEESDDNDDQEAAPPKPIICDLRKLGKNKVFRTDENGDIREIDLDEECEHRMHQKTTPEPGEPAIESSNSEKDEEEDETLVTTTKKPRPTNPDLAWKKRSPRFGKDVDVFAEMFLNKD